MPGWSLGSATLAAPNELTNATRALPDALIYPMFMSDGWFTKTTLPQHLEMAGASVRRILPPFGRDARLPDLAADMVRAAAQDAGHRPQQTTLIVAAHGAEKNPAAARCARHIADQIARLVPFHEIRLGFLEEPPYLQDAARIAPDRPAICLPLFAAGGAHVARDLPVALTRAGFRGPLLKPIGLQDGVPALIATALTQPTALP